MKKTSHKKLTLDRQVVKTLIGQLSVLELKQVEGGLPAHGCSCRDSGCVSHSIDC